MESLTSSAFDHAASFVHENARPLERAQLDFHFGTGTVESVLIELRKFKNDDGGFGHGIEPDVRMPFSSPFSGTLAFQVLRELEVAGDDPLVRDGIDYWVNAFDRNIGGWDPVGPRSDDYPRAPWWDYQPVGDQLNILKRSNPGAEIADYLHLYSQIVSTEFLDEVTTMAEGSFDALPDDMEVHVMMCFMRMAEMAPDVVAERLDPKLRRGVHLVTSGNVNDWQNYGGRPLWFAPKPDSLLADELEDSVQSQLDYEIAAQADDGSWKAFWSYGDREHQLATAKVEWAGYLTLRNLLAFKVWGRM